MNRIILLIFIPIFLNACALCSLTVPKMHAKIDFIQKDKNLLGLNIKWIFSKEFSTQLLNNYDLNNNKNFDADELNEMKELLLDYVEPRNFLMEATYYDNDNVSKNLEFKAKNYQINFDKNQIIFDFQIDCLLKLIEDRTIKIVLNDKENFFDFRILQSEKLKLYDSLYLISNTNNFVAFYKVSKSDTFSVKTLSSITPKIKQNDVVVVEDNSFYGYLKSTLQKYTNEIKTALQDIQDGNSLRKMFILLGFSFLYGFFHALGPGHGKTLVTSYFVANGGNWYKALLFSFRIGIIHVISAFVLVFSSIYIIKTFVSKVLNDISIYTSYISSIIIIMIALFMLYKKLKLKKHEHEHCCSCHSCVSTKNDWGIALSAGMIPCAGTVVIFIFTFTLGSYMIGILSALAMAVGMGSVIFVSSIFGQYLHVKISKDFTGLINVTEYLAIIFILMLGVSLLISPLQM